MICLMLLSLLSVVSVRAMLAHVVLLYEQWIHRSFRVHNEGNKCHLGTLFHYLCIVNCIVGTRTPREWTMVLNKYTRSVVWVDTLETLYNHISCFQLIVALHFFLCHIGSARDILIEIIGMSGTDVRNIFTSLSPSSSISRVGVYYSLNVWKCFIKYEMSRGI